MDIKPMLRAVGVGASLAVMVSVSGCSPSRPAIPWTETRMADAGPVRGALDFTEVDPPLPMLR